MKYLATGNLKSGTGASTLTLDGSNTGANELAQVIHNPGGFIAVTKNGAGAWALSAVNTYTGPTTVNNGTLRVNGSLPSGSAVTVNGGALGGTGTIGGGVTVAAVGSIAAGTSVGSTGTLTFSSAVTLNGTVVAEIANGPSADLVNFVGGATLNSGSTLTVLANGGLTSGQTFNLFDGSLSGTFTTLNLPGGPGHWNTSALYTLGEITFNNASPVATNLTLGCALGESVSFQVIAGKLAPTDADGDTMTVTAAGSASSGTSGFTANNVTYTANGTTGTHTFSYTVTDALGATDDKTVTVLVYASEGFNKLAGPTGSGPYSFSYLGIPGEDYALEETPDLPATGSSTWTTVATSTASGTGAVEFSGVTLSYPSGSFRTSHLP